MQSVGRPSPLKTYLKKLQFGEGKCHKLHVGAETNFCPDLFIVTWKVNVVEEISTGLNELNDEIGEEYKIKRVDKFKYLGDLICKDGRNEKNIKNRIIGIISQIMSILEEICFGSYYFEVAVLLRNSHLILFIQEGMH